MFNFFCILFNFCSDKTRVKKFYFYFLITSFFRIIYGIYLVYCCFQKFIFCTFMLTSISVLYIDPEDAIFVFRRCERYQIWHTCQTIHSCVSYALTIIIDTGLYSLASCPREIYVATSPIPLRVRACSARELPSETDAVLGREFYNSCAVITVLFKSPSRPRRYHGPHWSWRNHDSGK